MYFQSNPNPNQSTTSAQHDQDASNQPNFESNRQLSISTIDATRTVQSFDEYFKDIGRKPQPEEINPTNNKNRIAYQMVQHLTLTNEKGKNMADPAATENKENPSGQLREVIDSIRIACNMLTYDTGNNRPRILDEDSFWNQMKSLKQTVSNDIGTSHQLASLSEAIPKAITCHDKSGHEESVGDIGSPSISF